MKEPNSNNPSANISSQIKTTKIVYPQVYSYTLPELETNNGSQKIGYTERRDVDMRILEQTHTAAIKLNPKKQWSAPAFFADGETSFRDKDFHKFLIKSGIPHMKELGNEWFYFNGIPTRSKELFDTFRAEGFLALQRDGAKIPYTLRKEQNDAVELAINYFVEYENGEVLWNAKPRFGKTLASYDLAKRLEAQNVLIVTNRPAIANSWFDDFDMFIDGYKFVSEASSLSDRPSLTRDQYNQIDDTDKRMIAFLSLQDLKGSKYFGGPHDKLGWVADLHWDLLVIDEAHEGVDTDRTDAAFNIIKRRNTLHLSGTPFKALANNKFPNEAIFNWTYLDEQREKQAELADPNIGDSGAHTDLPDMQLYTYRISQMIADEINEGVDIDGEARDYAFDLNEFFATTNKKFIHEADVREFLRNLSTNTKYPFSTPELRDELRHTFWYVGNRVDSVKALERLLREDPIFKDYKVIVAAGDGKTFDEEEQDFKANEKSFDKVKQAIAKHPKTITLSCGQLTTGVTIKEWSAVLMLTDIKTPAQYMQAAFRAQNPYRFIEDGQQKAKQSAYLFDFAPSRVLQLYDQFANALNPSAVDGKITETERRDNIRELLNFFPVISEDVNGQMVELDAEKVLTFPSAIAATEIVKARFMTNLLFNDHIRGVFHFPKEVEEILDKMDKETGKRVKKDNKPLDLDNARKLEGQKTARINENTGLILGEKIYAANIERIVDGALADESVGEQPLDSIREQVSALVEPVIAKYTETYKSTGAELEDIRKEAAEKIAVAVAKYENSDIKDAEKLKENLKNVIEHDVVQQNVDQQETKKVETVQKSKEEEVREHLRAFTRTIPMFIMANSSRGEITIDNFDEAISGEDFIDLTNITKDEFHKLRDGFDYEEYDEATGRSVQRSFPGVFEKYRFNASIAEFIAERDKRANYFEVDDDIFELIPNQKNNQIFTPRRVVTMMLDSLQAESPEIFTSPDSKIIDLYMKSGMYITETVKRLYEGTKHLYDNKEECLRHILENQVYGLAPTGVLHGITNSYIFGFDQNHTISTKNFIQHDLLPEARDGTAAEKLAVLYNGGTMMKFDAVVGNPPYQEEISGSNNQATPIYNYFHDVAEKMSDIYSLISPARFLSGQGATPKAWNTRMLKDEHLKIVKFSPKSEELFPSVDIKGGVVVLLRNSNKNFGAIDTFIPFDELRSIYQRVKSVTPENISHLVYSPDSYRFADALFTEHPELIGRTDKTHAKAVASSVFTRYPEIFSETQPNDSEDYVQIYGRINNDRVFRWTKRKYIATHPNLDKWKIFVPGANGTGAIGEILSTPVIGHPVIGHNQTFISIGELDTEFEANALLKYIKSKFARAMLGIMKTTQNNQSRNTWSKVPLQDFTANSDIDWTESIPEIDQQLYAKYGLDQHEIDFIETRVKPME